MLFLRRAPGVPAFEPGPPGPVVCGASIGASLRKNAARATDGGSCVQKRRSCHVLLGVPRVAAEQKPR